VTYSDKIYSDWDQLVQLVNKWQANGERVVFTNGVFDILHRGHIHYLAEARALGDRLVVGVNSDTSVQRIKGTARPIQSEVSRAALLAGMQAVSAVALFGEDTPLQLITALQPDTLVKGGDYQLEDIVGADEVIQSGGEVSVLSYLEGYSSTSIINKIKSL